MFSLLCRRRGRNHNLVSPRKLRCEQLEDRRMLAGTQADIIFLLDESQSNTNGNPQDWLAGLISGDADRDGVAELPSLATQLADPAIGIDDVRYGLIGFGEQDGSIQRFAHTQLMVPGDPTSLLIDADDLDTTEINDVFEENPKQFGGVEDGWDAIEHAIAEYEIRDGAVPIFVLVQSDEGRAPLNRTLTREGILGVGAFLAA